MIAITGIGLTVPGANSLAVFVKQLLSRRVSTSRREIQHWGDVPVGLCDCPQVRPHKVRTRGTRAGDLACYAAAQAMGDDTPDAIICGISEHGGAYTQQECHEFLTGGAPRPAVSPLYLQRMIANAPAGEVAQYLHCTGIVRTISTACAAGLSAIIEGCEMLLSGRAEVVLAGGASEAPESYGSFAGFFSLGALAKDCARPFGHGRDGVVVSEGACFIRLELADRTTRPIMGTIEAWAETCDADHPTTASGHGLMRAVSAACDGLEIVGTIAHATGTQVGDEIELEQIPGRATSIKGAIGHTMGAAGAVNVAVASTGLLPACVGCTDPISDRVLMSPLQGDGLIACTALGMWGQNAVAVVRPRA